MKEISFDISKNVVPGSLDVGSILAVSDRKTELKSTCPDVNCRADSPAFWSRLVFKFRFCTPQRSVEIVRFGNRGDLGTA